MINSKLYEQYGSFVKKDRVNFCVYAPDARYVSVIGDFNSYNKDINPMQKDENGNWNTTIKKALEGQTYKYFPPTAHLLLHNQDKASKPRHQL